MSLSEFARWVAQVWVEFLVGALFVVFLTFVAVLVLTVMLALMEAIRRIRRDDDEC